MSNTFPSVGRLPLVGGVGTVGYKVLNSAIPPVTLIARTTANVTEIFAGTGYSIYQTTISVPDATLTGVVIWDDGSGNADAVPFNIVTAEGAPGINFNYAGILLTSASEIDRIYSSIGVDLRVEDLSGGDQTTAMNEIIAAASETVTSYTQRIYNTSDLVNVPWVRRRATIIACYYLSMRRGNGTQFTREYERVMEDLEKFLTATPPMIPAADGFPVPVRSSLMPAVSDY